MDLLEMILGVLLGGGSDQYDPRRPTRFGPLGVTFEGDGGVATEISGTYDDPRSPGRYLNAPSLTPNQVDMQNILAGRQMTPQQMRLAVEWALKSGLDFPSYGSISEAEKAARERSQTIARRFY